MWFGVLGSLEVRTDEGTPVELATPKLRALLTLLLSEAGRVVSVDRITECLWGTTPPASAAGTLQAYVSQLRRLLEPDRAPRAAPQVLLTRGDGYLVDVSTDVATFERSLAEGERLLAAGSAAQADDLLLAALELWRGEPFADLAEADPSVVADRARLRELHLVAHERHTEALLARGRPDLAAAELERLVAVHPLRERLSALLMLALYRSGRQSDALQAFTALRDRLRDELGVDPDPELRRLETAILNQDPELDLPTAPGPESARGFVGRGPELQALLARTAAAVGGHGCIVLVAGEPGIGKSRLAEEAASVAGRHGMRVVWSRCADEVATPALWPWTQVLRALDAVSSLQEPDAAGADLDARRVELFERIGAQLAAAATRHPLLVVLDDLHGADPLSLHLLRFLAGRVGELPIAVIATLRDTLADRTDALVHTLADLARARPVLRLRLTGLDGHEVVELLAAHGLPDRDLAARLQVRTEGNPFFLVELIELMKGSAPPGDVPASVRDVLERRLQPLPTATRDLLTLAAVIGKEFPLDLLEAAAELDAAQIGEHLEPAVLAGLVIEEGDGWVWRFSHELVREAIAAGLTRSARGRLHQRIVAGLESLPTADRLDVLAHHAYLAGPFAQPGAALRYALAAAEAARARYAFATAAEHLARAVTLADSPDGPTKHELLVALARDRRATGDVRGPQAALVQAIALARAQGDTEAVAEAATVFGDVALWPWRDYWSSDEEIIGLLDDLVAETAGQRDRRRIELLGTLACELYHTDRRPEGVEHAREAVRIAREVGDVALLGRALNSVYLAGWDPEHEAERRAAVDEALGLAGLPKHTEAVARLHRAAMALRAADPELSRADLARAHRLTTELGLAELRAQVLLQETGHATLRGDWELASRRSDEAYALQRYVTLWGAQWCRLVQRMTVHWGQGRLAELAGELVDTTVGELAGLRPLAALALAEAGDRAAAMRLVADTPRELRLDWGTDFMRCVWGEVAAALGAPDPAALYRDLLPQAEQLVVAGTANVCWGSVQTLLGRLALRCGDAVAARRHLEAATQIDAAVGGIPWEARARRALAEL